MKPYTLSDALSEDFRHIADCIPERFHFQRAEYHARQVALSAGQTKFQHIKKCLDHLRDGLDENMENN